MSWVAELRRDVWHLRNGGLEGLRRHRERDRVERQNAGLDGGRTRFLRRLSAPAEPEPLGPPEFEEWPATTTLNKRHGLRVAVILDDFSTSAFSFEWDQVPLSRETWREDLEREGVDLLFVESAWAGNDGEWRYQLTGKSGVKPEFRHLLEWCRARGIPTVFWNKEDPVHHQDFLEAAALFDVVFTTDGEMVPHYREVLGHDRVAVLPFAAAPALHNPIRRLPGRAERDVAFAGMYFAHRHRERREQMEMLLGAAVDVSPRMRTGLEIFSRQLGGDERYQFPAPFDSHVVGSLGYRRMLSAYRAYKVFLNVNTVVGSPTMCARRIFEITASGTPVVSTPSPAIDAVFATSDVAQVAERQEAGFALRALVASPDLRDRMAHRAQRTIWEGHTYAHRVDDVLEAVGLTAFTTTRRRTRVTALVSSIRPEYLGHVLAQLGAQRGVDVQLAYLAHGWDVDEADVRRQAREHGLDDVVVLSAEPTVPLGECLNRLVAVADGDQVAKFDDDDLYGPDYLADQSHALGYSGAEIVGKQAHFVRLEATGVTALRFAEREHRFTDFVMGPTIVAYRDAARQVPFRAVHLGEDSGFLRDAAAAGLTIYSADRFGFVQVRRSAGHTWSSSDMELLASSVTQTTARSADHHLA